MSNVNKPSLFKRLFGWMRRNPAPAGTNAGPLKNAVAKYIANFREIQSVGKKNNLYGNNFKNLPMNKPLIKALRNYIAAVSNFKQLNNAGYGPKAISKQNVLNAANKAIKAATVANNKLENVVTLRNAYAQARPLVNTTQQLYNKLLKGSGLPANEVQQLSANGALNRALQNSQQKLANLKSKMNAAEAAAGTGAAPPPPNTTQAVAGYATGAALSALKQVLSKYNNAKLNATKQNNVTFYRNMANFNARLAEVNAALANTGLTGSLNAENAEKLRKVKVILNQAKALRNGSLKEQVGNYIWDELAYGGLMGLAPAKPSNYPRLAENLKARIAKGGFFNIKTLNGPELKAYLSAKKGRNAPHMNRAQGIANALIAIKGN